MHDISGMNCLQSLAYLLEDVFNLVLTENILSWILEKINPSMLSQNINLTLVLIVPEHLKNVRMFNDREHKNLVEDVVILSRIVIAFKSYLILWNYFQNALFVFYFIWQNWIVIVFFLDPNHFHITNFSIVDWFLGNNILKS